MRHATLESFGVGGMIEEPCCDTQRPNPITRSPHGTDFVGLAFHYGIHLLENLKLDVLAAKGVSEFAFIMQPLKIQGGTGSTVAPIAVR